MSNIAPIVTASNKTATHGQSLAASTLFTANDSDGDTITQYDLWDNGAAGGSWVVNGQVQAIGTDDYITAMQLAQTSRARAPTRCGCGPTTAPNGAIGRAASR